MKATEQYFPVVVFTMLYYVLLTFEAVDENQKWSLKWNLWLVLSFGTVYYAVQGCSDFRSLRGNI